MSEPNRKRQDPSPADFEAWERKLAEGDEPSQAAKDLGFTASGFRRIDPDRHQAALAMGRLARADFVDRTMERWIKDPDRSDALRILWAKRWNGAYAEKGQLEVSGPEGAPLVVEGRAVVGLADVVRLARELDLGHLVGLNADDPRAELAPVGELLPGSAAD